MKNDIKETDVYWEMDWSQLNEDGSRKYPNRPEKELVFEKEVALAHLLINEVIFLNDHWWEKEWTEETKKTFSVNLNVNDVFAWACADSEEIYHGDIQDVYDHWKIDPIWGTAVWVMKKRNELPQEPVYEMIKKQGIWDLDSMGLEPNNYDELWKKKMEEK